MGPVALGVVSLERAEPIEVSMLRAAKRNAVTCCEILTARVEKGWNGNCRDGGRGRRQIARCIALHLPDGFYFERQDPHRDSWDRARAARWEACGVFRRVWDEVSFPRRHQRTPVVDDRRNPPRDFR